MRTLKVLSKESEPNGMRQRLVSFLEYTRCAAIHVLRITDKQTLAFPWELILSISLPPANICDPMVVAEQARLALGSADTQWLLVDERAFGVERSGAQLITSCYNWAKNTESDQRMKHMLEHLEMEARQRLYSAVHFASVLTSNPDIVSFPDFVFEGYVDEPDGISKIYRDPLLHQLREHSSLFLDTETRQLAFGHVEIIAS